jgi:hypothetical protein
MLGFPTEKPHLVFGICNMWETMAFVGHGWMIQSGGIAIQIGAGAGGMPPIID